MRKKKNKFRKITFIYFSLLASEQTENNSSEVKNEKKNKYFKGQVFSAYRSTRMNQ